MAGLTTKQQREKIILILTAYIFRGGERGGRDSRPVSFPHKRQNCPQTIVFFHCLQKQANAYKFYREKICRG